MCVGMHCRKYGGELRGDLAPRPIEIIGTEHISFLEKITNGGGGRLGSSRISSRLK